MVETVQTKPAQKKQQMCPIMVDMEDYNWLKTQPRGLLTKLTRNAIKEAREKGNIKILPDERAHLNPCDTKVE